jgi:predicted outer membrane repeat protein
LLDPLEPRRLLTTWYVDASSPAPTPDGSSWSTAYTDLQLALAAATSGDTIKVAQGTYKPTSTTDRTVNFQLINGVALYGGYAGSSSTAPDTRDASLYPTTLSGDIGTPGDNSDNSYQILVAADTDATAVFDGFTVTAANGISGISGAIYFANDTTATISNCVFTANTATDANGAAIYTDYASPYFSNCLFSNNAALGYSGGGRGGAVNDEGGVAPTFVNCTFTNNSAQRAGGAIRGVANLSGCIFTDNSAEEEGGALEFYASGTITDCTFTGNSAVVGGAAYLLSGTHLSNSTFAANSAYAGDGGAVYIRADANVTNCTFIRNFAAGDGGAVATNTGSSSPKFFACAFYGNSASNGGAIRSASYSAAWPLFAECLFVGNVATGNRYGAEGGAMLIIKPATVTNCTFTANTASGTDSIGGAVFTQYETTTFSNSIFWANAAAHNAQFYLPTYSAAPKYCDIQDGPAGNGNVVTDPLFVRSPDKGPDATWGTPDDDYGDLRLLPSSPCLDAGSNAALSAGTTTDLAGRPRIADFPGVGPAGTAVVDMGAYESSADLGDLHVGAGQTVALPAGGYAFTATRLIVDPGGTLDLTDDSLLIQYDGASPLAVVRSALASGYHNGAWTGTGITSSAARATPHRAVGYAEAASIGLTTYAGHPVDGPALLLKYTLAGDATLDGRLNGDDFALADRGRARGGFDNWVHGDFDYDAAVTDADLSILDAAFAPPPPPPAPIAATIPPAPAGADTTSTPVTTAVLTPDDPIAPVPPPAPAPTNQPTHPKHHHHKAKHARKHVRAAGHEAKHAKPAHAAGAKPKAKPAHAGPLHKLDLRPYFARPQRRGR